MHSNHALPSSSLKQTLAHRLATTTQLYVSKMSFIFWCASINGISIPSSLLLFCPQSFTLVSLPHALWNTIAELQMPCVCSRAKPSARHRESGIGGCKARYPLMLIGNSLWIIQQPPASRVCPYNAWHVFLGLFSAYAQAILNHGLRRLIHGCRQQRCCSKHGTI